MALRLPALLRTRGGTLLVTRDSPYLNSARPAQI